MTDLDELERKARAASEGPWFVRKEPTSSGLAVIEDGRHDGLFPITAEWHEARFIAAANPAVILALIERVRAAEALRNESDWHEDDGPVLWWAYDDGQLLGEPPYVGSPIDTDWPGYHTHWTRLVVPPFVATKAKP